MQVTIRMPDEHINRIGHIAKKMGRTKADVARMAIRKFLEEYGEKDTVKPFAKVQHLIGVVESGIPDLGLRHREHMMTKMRAGRE